MENAKTIRALQNAEPLTDADFLPVSQLVENLITGQPGDTRRVALAQLADFLKTLTEVKNVGSVDFDSLTAPGNYIVTGSLHAPNAGSTWRVFVWGSGTALMQEAIYYSSGIAEGFRFWRKMEAGAWLPWQSILGAGHVADASVFDLTGNSRPQSGIYTVDDGASIGLTAGWHHIIQLRHKNPDNNNAQIAIPFGTKDVKYRFGNGAWKTLANLESPVFTGTPKVRDASGSENRVAVAAATADAGSLDLPVGSYIMAAGTCARNAQAAPGLSAAGGYYDLASGNALSGTWRSCGHQNLSADNATLCRRVA